MFTNIILETENVNYNPKPLLDWIKQHPDRFNQHLNRQLKDLDIVEKDDTIYLYGNNYYNIDLNHVNYNDIEDIITIPELIDNGIVTDPIFIVQADLSDDPYSVQQVILGITDNYEDAEKIAIEKTNGYASIDLAKLNQPIDIPAGFYLS